LKDDVGNRGLGSIANTLANRPGFVLDLTGPSLFVDTACSSTLTAMHLAIRSIESGDCDAAIVGGCQHNMKYIFLCGNHIFLSHLFAISMWDWWSYSNAGVLSSDSKCKPFDSNADGFVDLLWCCKQLMLTMCVALN
jgi:acyl transferase domain-containing protein